MGEGKEAQTGKELHLCKLVKRDEMEQVRQLVKDAAYFCKKCGRAAREPGNLCEPARI
jgi:hypothetical protein